MQSSTTVWKLFQVTLRCHILPTYYTGKQHTQGRFWIPPKNQKSKSDTQGRQSPSGCRNMTNEIKTQCVPCPNKADRLSASATAVVNIKETKQGRSTHSYMLLVTRCPKAFYSTFRPFSQELLQFFPLFPDFTYAKTPLHNLPQDNFSEKVFSTNLRRILQCSETRTFTGNESD